MQYRLLLGLTVVCLASAAHASFEGCPKWMTPAQCAQVSGLDMAVFRIAPLDREPGEGCMNDGLMMCARSINRSFANYHVCPGLPRAIRCDIHYCEYDSCLETSCHISDSYCCAKQDNQEPPDWDTAEADSCEF